MIAIRLFGVPSVVARRGSPRLRDAQARLRAAGVPGDAAGRGRCRASGWRPCSGPMRSNPRAGQPAPPRPPAGPRPAARPGRSRGCSRPLGAGLERARAGLGRRRRVRARDRRRQPSWSGRPRCRARSSCSASTTTGSSSAGCACGSCTRNLDRAAGASDRASATTPLAIAYAQEMLRCDPWREDAVRHLIRLRRQAGDRAGALVEYERFAERLRAEIDVDPMPETVAEYESVLHDAPPRGPARGRAGPASGRASSCRSWAGRSSSRRSRPRSARAARGYGRLVLVGGEAGAGKSRLLSELGAFAQAPRGARASGARPRSSRPRPTKSWPRRSARRRWLETAVIEPIWLAALAADRARDRRAATAPSRLCPSSTPSASGAACSRRSRSS